MSPSSPEHNFNSPAHSASGMGRNVMMRRFHSEPEDAPVSRLHLPLEKPRGAAQRRHALTATLDSYTISEAKIYPDLLLGAISFNCKNSPGVQGRHTPARSSMTLDPPSTPTLPRNTIKKRKRLHSRLEPGAGEPGHSGLTSRSQSFPLVHPYALSASLLASWSSFEPLRV